VALISKQAGRVSGILFGMANGNIPPQPGGLGLQTLALLGLTPAQPKQPEPQPQPAATGVLDKIGQVLSNPAVQGLAATYLGAISSPRYMGWGGAIGRGGLAGLGQFSRAEQMRQLIPLERAQIQKIGADTQLAGARSKLAQAETGQYEGAPALAQHFAVLADNETDPSKQTMYALLTYGLQHGMKVSDAIRAYSSGDLNETRKALAAANIKLAGAKTQTEAMRPGEILTHEQTMRTSAGANAERAAIEQQLEPARAKALASETALHAGQLAALPGKNANAQLTKINTDLGRFATTNPLHFYSNRGSWVQDAARYAQSQNPGADPNAILQAAQALGRVPGGASVAPAAASSATRTDTSGRRWRLNAAGTGWVPVP
jgi:hypothetical protein